LEPGIKEDIRSSKLTNRSIHAIKKILMREEALKVTPQELLENSPFSSGDIWDIDYKSTSDEEDNDSDEDEMYNKQK